MLSNKEKFTVRGLNMNCGYGLLIASQIFLMSLLIDIINSGP